MTPAKLLLVLLFLFAGARAQGPDSTNGWGYRYADLLADLAKWRASPYVAAESIGASVENRALWMIRISDNDDSAAAGRPKHRVFIHARTHPGEVQANWIADEVIKLLLDGTARSAALRHDFIFDIVPMYNPDGVEHGHGRLNAHLVDLESDWDKPDTEPEVKALRRKFKALMASQIPVEVALNLHSDSLNCTRFFFYHEAAGTSQAYSVMEKSFIENVRAYFTAGIEDWFFVRSWATGTAARYPEGFWWLNYGDKVMALTYEDDNCHEASHYDSTARALVLGSVDYINARVPVIDAASEPPFRLLRRDGGLLLVGPPRTGGLPWSLAAADGRVLVSGVLENGAAFIPVPPLAIRPAWLILRRADRTREAHLVEAFRP